MESVCAFQSVKARNAVMMDVVVIAAHVMGMKSVWQAFVYASLIVKERSAVMMDAAAVVGTAQAERCVIITSVCVRVMITSSVWARIFTGLTPAATRRMWQRSASMAVKMVHARQSAFLTARIRSVAMTDVAAAAAVVLMGFIATMESAAPSVFPIAKVKSAVMMDAVASVASARHQRVALMENVYASHNAGP